jgi:hypothetical protein
VSVVDFIEISQADAITAVRDASWIQYRPELATCGHRGCEDHPGGVQRIHSLSVHGFGADWDVDEAVAFIESAQRCGWLVGPGMPGHDLAVVGADGRRMRFEAKRPVEVVA